MLLHRLYQLSIVIVTLLSPHYRQQLTVSAIRRCRQRFKLEI